MGSDSDIKISLEWDGETLSVVVKKPLTTEQYDALRRAPSMLAMIVLDKASDHILQCKCRVVDGGL